MKFGGWEGRETFGDSSGESRGAAYQNYDGGAALVAVWSPESGGNMPDFAVRRP